ncbi:MAG: site-specific integrase [Candidatus Acidiferrales bacterium]
MPEKHQATTGQLVPMTAGTADGMLCVATRIRQQRKAGRSMSKRSGQSGSVHLVGCKWYGRYWRDVPGKEKREHAHVILGERSSMTKPEARRKLMEIIEAEGVNGPQHLDRALKPAVTFSSIADAWEAKRLPLLHTSSQFITPSRLRNHVRPFFGNMTIEEIRTGTVNDWIRTLTAKRLEPKTIDNLWKDFRAIVNWHRKQMDQPKVSWYPDLPALPDDEQRWFTQAEIKQIVDAATGQHKVLFHLAGYTGLRSGELVGLRVEDLKLDHGVIEVRRAVWNGIEGETKTKSGKRNVFIDSATIRLLRDFLDGRQSGRLFRSRVGTTLENRDICRRILTPLCKKLGIKPGGMHAFRHGRVSHMQASMMPGDFVKNQIGHSDLRITSNYTHFEHRQKREMVEKLLSCTQSADLYTVANHGKAS